MFITYFDCLCEIAAFMPQFRGGVVLYKQEKSFNGILGTPLNILNMPQTLLVNAEGTLNGLPLGKVEHCHNTRTNAKASFPEIIKH